MPADCGSRVATAQRQELEIGQVPGRTAAAVEHTALLLKSKLGSSIMVIDEECAEVVYFVCCSRQCRRSGEDARPDRQRDAERLDPDATILGSGAVPQYLLICMSAAHMMRCIDCHHALYPLLVSSSHLRRGFVSEGLPVVCALQLARMLLTCND